MTKDLNIEKRQWQLPSQLQRPTSDLGAQLRLLQAVPAGGARAERGAALRPPPPGPALPPVRIPVPDIR